MDDQRVRVVANHMLYEFSNGQSKLVPIVTGRPVVKNGQVVHLKVKCPFCRKEHTHGESEGTRLSHCSDTSAASDYFILPEGCDAPTIMCFGGQSEEWLKSFYPKWAARQAAARRWKEPSRRREAPRRHSSR